MKRHIPRILASSSVANGSSPESRLSFTAQHCCQSVSCALTDSNNISLYSSTMSVWFIRLPSSVEILLDWLYTSIMSEKNVPAVCSSSLAVAICAANLTLRTDLLAKNMLANSSTADSTFAIVSCSLLVFSAKEMVQDVYTDYSEPV